MTRDRMGLAEVFAAAEDSAPVSSGTSPEAGWLRVLAGRSSRVGAGQEAKRTQRSSRLWRQSTKTAFYIWSSVAP